MKKLSMSIFTIFVLAFMGCNKSVTPTPTESGVYLNLSVNYDSIATPFVYYQPYAYGGGNVRFSRVSFFLTNIVLTKEDGTNVTASESQFVDCSNFIDANKAKDPITLKTDGIPFGKYTKITFTVGVTDALNTKNPSNFALSSPLSNTDMYWASWNSYIFSKIEGTLDKNKDGVYETGITLHTGGEKVAQTRTLPISLTVADGGSNSVYLAITFNDFLKTIDLNSITQTHQLTDINTMRTIVNNVADAIKVK